MRKYIGWAVLCALIMGWSGAAHGQSASVPICEDGTCGYDAVSCGDCIGNWFDNTMVFAGVDAYKSIGERVTNIAGGPGALTGSFGAVAGFNTGFALGDSNIRGQVGGSYGVYDFRGRLAIVPQSDEEETQTYLTAGFYKRGDMLTDCDPISWGLVLDSFHADQWGVNANTLALGQVRGIFGYAWNECTEIGVWGTLNAWDDNAQVTVAGGGPFRTVRAMNQANLYLKRNSEFGAQVAGYVGIFDSADVASWQFGLMAQSPLSYNTSLYSNFNYVVPGAPAGAGGSGEEQFSVSVGLCYYFGCGKAVSPSISGHKGLPMLNVANNGSFLVTD